MNIDLFGQSLLVSLCSLSVGLTTYILLRVKKQLLARLFGAALLIALAVQTAIVAIIGSADGLPSLLILMILPFTLSVCLPVAIRKSRQGKKIAKKRLRKSRLAIYLPTAGNIFCCLLFSLSLINGYYRYYPTLYSLWDFRGPDVSLNANGQVVLQYNPASIATVNRPTIETSIYNNSSVATAGKLYSVSIPGTASKFHPRTGWVYVPAIASNDANALNLPVLVLVAGFPGAPGDWLHGVRLVATMDAFAKEHHGIAPLVFVVDDTGSQFNDTECVNSPRGNVETYLTQDVPHYIEAHFPASSEPANWAIGGISMGGMCSAMISLLHPNIYHYFVDIGGDIGPSTGTSDQTVQELFRGSTAAWQVHQPDWLLQNRSYTGMGGFFASGKGDSPDVIVATRELYADSKKDGLDTVYESADGNHTFDVFAQIFQDSLPWISNRIGATACGDSTTCS